MPCALFSVLPPNAVLPQLIQDLHRIGVTTHNVATMRFGSSPDTTHTAHGEGAPRSKVNHSHSLHGRRIQATGQLKWALMGASSTGTTRRVARALAGMGMAESGARRYQDLVQTGNTLLCIFCENPSQAKEAVTVLQRSGVREIETTAAHDPMYRGEHLGAKTKTTLH